MQDSRRHPPTVLLGMREDGPVDLAFLVGYVALLVLAYWRARSLAWMTVVTTGIVGVTGALISLGMDHGHPFDRIQLQWILLADLALVLVLALIPRLGFGWRFDRRPSGCGVKRQFLAIGLPALAILVFLIVMTTFWTEGPAFTHPVSFLIGHSTAEDNAKWLDFTSQFAAGGSITQGVPMGGPLQLLLTFVGTVMGTISMIALGGYNQVAVAANTVIFGEYFMVALMPLALAPLAEMRLVRQRIPAPLLVISALVLSMTALVVIGYGHLTFQFTLLITALWSAVFLSSSRIPRAKLLTSLAVAAGMTVWLPLNVVAVVILVGWGLVLIVRPFVTGRRRFDVVGIVLLLLVAIGVFQPIWSSLTFLLSGTSTTASGSAGGASGSAVSTSVLSGIGDSTLYAANGGTEQVGPLLAVLTAAVVVAAALVLKSGVGRGRFTLYVRFLPIAILAFFAVVIIVLDFWSTGSGPHYGAMKFTFLVATMALGSCLPLALLGVDNVVRDRMSAAKWLAVGGVIVVLAVDTILPRAVALARPQQWSPPIPFNNSSGSYWWPADVNGTGNQPIATNPVACVYLPPGYKVPTAIIPSGLSDPQRVYSCTRQLAGLSGSDTSAQPLVDWLRREWFTNTPAWSDVYDSLAAMPADVQAKPVILLDEGSNIVGLSSVAELLQRYPKTAAQ